VQPYGWGLLKLSAGAKFIPAPFPADHDSTREIGSVSAPDDLPIRTGEANLICRQRLVVSPCRCSTYIKKCHISLFLMETPVLFRTPPSKKVSVKHIVT